MPSFTVRRSRIKELKDVAGMMPDSVAQKILENNSWDVSQALNDLMDNPYKYPDAKPAKGDERKLTTLFKKFVASEEPDVMDQDGLVKFFKACGVDPEGYETLVIAWMIEGSDLGIFPEDEFVRGFAALGCSTIDDIKKKVKSKVSALKSSEAQFNAFYKWIFLLAREDDKKKTIDKGLAIALWKLCLGHKSADLPLLAKWLEWLDSTKDSAINRDCWELCYPFLKETKSVDTYDDSAAWPVQMDEFIDAMSS